MKLYTTIARSLTTLMPVIIGMFAITAYLIFESADLISARLPESMTGWTRIVASYFVAIGLHLTVLNTAINSRLVGRLYAFLFAIAAFLITAIYFDAFGHAGKTATEILFGYLISIFIGLANFVYVDLFVAKWKEHLGNLDLEKQLAKANEELMMTHKELTTANEQLKFTYESLEKSNEELTVAQRDLTFANDQLTVESQKSTKLEEELTNALKNVTNREQKVKDLSLQLQQIDQYLQDLQSNFTKLEKERDQQLQAANEGRLCHDCYSVLKNKQALSRHKRDCSVYKAKQNGQLTSN
jgi:methyl-accepting chemotaxis protein